jgi:fibronectin type 3 domain-containing protein
MLRILLPAARPPALPAIELIAAALLLSGCGYIGSPLPPLANIPAPVTDLAAVQRDARIIVHFKLPTTTTENVTIKSALRLDLRIGTSAEGTFRAGEWVKQAKSVPPGDLQGGVATYAIPSAEWTGKNVIIAARVIGANGKESNWSALEALPVVPPPEKPAKPRIENTAEGLRLTWEGPPADYRIYRRAGDEKFFSPVADVQQPTWTDRTSEFGTHYTYIVQRIVKLGVHKEAESDQSEEASETPIDRFPPAAPAGLRASAAAGSIELSWDRNPEPDLAGYRVYRAVLGGAFEKIAELSQVPSYSDRAVESGKQYRYVIRAFDKSANESGQSAVVEATVP